MTGLRLRPRLAAFVTRLRSLRERPLEQRHVRATVVLVAGLGLAAAGFAALGPSLGAFTATVSSQAEVGAGSLDLSLNAPSGQPTCTASAADGFSATCSGADVTTTGAPGQVNSVDWQAASSGTITPENDSGFTFSLTPSSCSGSNTTVCSDTEVAVTEWAAATNLATPLPATGAGMDFAEVTCPSVSTCVAVGQTASSDPVGLAMVSSDGGATWSAPVFVPGSTLLQSVSCPSATTCVAVGYDGSSAGVASVGTAPTTAGDPWTWTAAVDVAGTSGLQGVDCPSTTECVAVGANSSGVGVAVSSSDGGSSWSAPQELTGTSFSYGVACPSTTTCLVVTAGASSGEAFVGTDSSGSWSWATSSGLTLPSGDVVYTLACPSADACLGSGAGSDGIVDTLDYSSTAGAWSWGTPEEIAGTSSLGAVACTSTSDCVAVGDDAVSGGYQAVSVTTTDAGATWSTPNAVSGPSEGFQDVACASATGGSTCSAVSYQHSATSTDTGQSWVGYQPLTCVYGTPSGSDCSFSSTDTLSTLGVAGTLSLKPSSVANPGVLVEVSTQLVSTASTSDEGAIATVPLGFTVSG